MTTAIGTRVRIARTVDNSPDIIVRPGATGTLVHIDDEGAYWVELDEPIPALNEWHNQLQIWCWGGEDAAETFIEAIT